MEIKESKPKERHFVIELTEKELATLYVAFGCTSPSERNQSAKRSQVEIIESSSGSQELYNQIREALEKNCNGF